MATKKGDKKKQTVQGLQDDPTAAAAASQDSAALIVRAARLPEEDWPVERMTTLLRTCIPKDATVADVAAFLAVAVRYELDPLVGQIFLMSTSQGMRIGIERDGFIALAARHPGYQGVQAGVVCKGDEFHMIVTSQGIQLDHEISMGERGDVVGAYCIAHHQDWPPLAIYRPADYYAHLRQDHRKQPWKVYYLDMYENRVIAAALRRRYPIGALYLPEEFESVELGPGLSRRVESATRDRTEALKDRLTDAGAALQAEGAVALAKPKVELPPVEMGVPAEALGEAAADFATLPAEAATEAGPATDPPPGPNGPQEAAGAQEPASGGMVVGADGLERCRDCGEPVTDDNRAEDNRCLPCATADDET